MAVYSEDFVTINGEMLRQVRNAVSNLANCDYAELPQGVQQSIKVLTGEFGYRLGAVIPNQENTSSGILENNSST